MTLAGATRLHRINAGLLGVNRRAQGQGSHATLRTSHGCFRMVDFVRSELALSGELTLPSHRPGRIRPHKHAGGRWYPYMPLPPDVTIHKLGPEARDSRCPAFCLHRRELSMQLAGRLVFDVNEDMQRLLAPRLQLPGSSTYCQKFCDYYTPGARCRSCSARPVHIL